MPESVRLTKEEQKKLTTKCNEINKARINNGKTPYQESELIHEILKIGLKTAMINKNFEVCLF